MERRIHKLFWVWEFEKEERWLNDMAAQGWVLSKVGFCTYTFEQAKRGEYTLRLELLDEGTGTEAGKAYIDFVESTGAEYIGFVARWVYFRKRTSEGAFDLFSDIDSRIAHVRRILNLLVILIAMQLATAHGVIRQFFTDPSGAMVIFGCLYCLLWVTMIYGSWRIYRMKARLEKERALHE